MWAMNDQRKNYDHKYSMESKNQLPAYAIMR